MNINKQGKRSSLGISVLNQLKENRTADHWFCRIPQFAKEDFVEGLKKVQSVGIEAKDSYQSLSNLLEERGEEWCISSQNLWGIPIPIFFIKGQNKQQFFVDRSIINYIREKFEIYGSDIWWKWKIEDLLPPKHKHRADMLEKGDLVFDNWFESGCSWYAILTKRIHETNKMLDITADGNLKLSGSEILVENEEEQLKKSPSNLPEKYPANMVVEGLDQNDGLLQAISLVAGIPFNHILIFSKYQGLSSFLSYEKSFRHCRQRL